MVSIDVVLPLAGCGKSLLGIDISDRYFNVI